jgi:AraC family transcriptional regulator
VIDQSELRRQEYVGRINRVIDYVRENIAGDLRLATLAGVANFSSHHFHRVFKSIVGETLSDFVRRLRAQKAASQLIHNPALTITEIAVGCGYSSSSAFAREFRQRFGVSASQFRAGGPDSLVRFRRELEERGVEFTNPPDLTDRRTDMIFRVGVREEPERHVAYIRHVGRYNEIGDAFQRLMRWAGPRRLLRFPETEVLAIYHDNPDVTPASQLRADACVTVPVGTKVKRDIGTMTLPGGTYAVAHVEIDVTQYGEAWERLIGEWLPQSGYQPDDRPCYELYLNDPRKHPEEKHIVDICEPVRPL